jgi:arsenate reductase (thioredoxin)
MSQALFEMAADGKHEASSAGTEPATHVHPVVVTAMREMGVELSDRVPRVLTNELAQWADVVVTMGCGDACPVIPGKRYIDWELQNPKDLPMEDVRGIRDDIKQRVGHLVESLNRKSQ